MVTRVQKWGNSQGLRLAKRILRDASIAVGDEVNVTVRGGVIVITPLNRMRGKQSLKELVSRIPENYRPDEATGGSPSAERFGESRIDVFPSPRRSSRLA
jgi:antitoxin MazE